VKNNLYKKMKFLFAKQNIRKIFKAPLFLIMLISLLARMLYYSCLTPYTLYPDSLTYLNFDKNIFLGQVDASRTPVYPYFIKIIRNLFGQNNILENVVFIQDVILFLTIVVAYYIAKNIFKNKSTVYIIALLYGCAPCILNFTHTILTETLSLSFFVMFFGLVVLYIKKPNNLMAVLIGLSVFILVMTRPAFLFIIPIMVVFWILRFTLQNRERRRCIIGMVAVGMSTVLIIGYSYLNDRQNDVFSVSVVSTFNQIGNLAQMGIYDKGDDKEIIDTIEKYRAKEKGEYAWKGEYTWAEATLKVFRMYTIKRLNAYANNTISNNFGDYIKGNIKRALNSSGQSIFATYASYKDNDCAKIISLFTESNGFLSFGFLFFLIFFDFIILIVLWVRNKSVPWLKAGIWIFVAGQTLTVIIGSPSEWARLIYPELFFISIIAFYYLDIITSGIKNYLIKKKNLKGA